MLEKIASRIKQLTVPCSDNGKNFINTERLDLITQTLLNSNYELLTKKNLANIYRHRDFQPGRPVILVSTHIDSVYKKYFARTVNNNLHGNFDNSATNAIIVEAMLNNLLPAQVLISFTGDEERKSKGADQTIATLGKLNLLENLELVISLDLTEEYYDKRDYTIENYFVKQDNQLSLLKFSRKREFINYLGPMLDSPVFINDDVACPDESWQYDKHDLNCFSLCLPCLPLNSNMHDKAGVSITLDSVAGYMNTLTQLTHSVLSDLKNKTDHLAT